MFNKLNHPAEFIHVLILHDEPPFTDADASAQKEHDDGADRHDAEQSEVQNDRQKNKPRETERIRDGKRRQTGDAQSTYRCEQNVDERRGFTFFVRYRKR